MENLERLTKILRYAGLNLQPQVVQIILDKNIRDLIDTLNERLTANPELGFDDVDAIVEAINKAAMKQAEAEAAKAEAKVGKGKAVGKKAGLEKV